MTVALEKISQAWGLRIVGGRRLELVLLDFAGTWHG